MEFWTIYHLSNIVMVASPLVKPKGFNFMFFSWSVENQLGL